MLGLVWPPPKGWKASVLGRDYPEHILDAFVLHKGLALGSSTPTKTPEQKQRSVQRIKERRAFKKQPTGLTKEQWVEQARKELLTKKNAAEERMDSLLSELPVKFRREHPMEIDGRMYFIDFLVTSILAPARKKVRVAIEVDGTHHYLDKFQIEKDVRKDMDLLRTSRVNSVLRIFSGDVFHMDENKLMSLIKSCPHKQTSHIGGVMTKGACSTHNCRYPNCLCK